MGSAVPLRVISCCTGKRRCNRINVVLNHQWRKKWKDLRVRDASFLKAAAVFAAGAAACPPPRPPLREVAPAGATAGAAAAAAGAKEIQPGVLRSETLILENPTGARRPADDFNRWRPGTATASTGLQQIALDALWYIDPDAGVDGVWDNALAAEKPIYNDDFTQMTVKLRPGCHWSDGVEFTADDLYLYRRHPDEDAGFNYSGTVLTAISKRWKSPTNIPSSSTENSPTRASTPASPCAGAPAS